MTTKNNGIFIISLDFELYWGIRERNNVEFYKDRLIKTHDVVKRMLSLFTQYNIHSSWATVGFLFNRSRAELLKKLPIQLPDYSIDSRSPYLYINKNETLDKRFHFAPELIELIHKVPNQEIATHTYSHYYSLEGGQTREQFAEDLKMATRVAEENKVQIKSLVFPKNQCNHKYLKTLSKYYISCYRGSNENWIERVFVISRYPKLNRIFKFLNSFLMLTGYNTYGLQSINNKTPINIPESMFYRSYMGSNIFESLKLRRVLRAMEYAAKSGKVFHLWWHPHNFGRDVEKNLFALEVILKKYVQLNKKYKMISLNLSEITRIVLESNNLS